jgi:copper oxidase (laccase) domain-containing protein
MAWHGSGRLWGCRGAVVGPSIGPCCCQVDRPVREAFDANHAEAAAWFAEDGAGKWKLDLWASTADQLERAGLRRGAIDMVRLCTVHHPEVCHSFRRDRGTARMTAAIRLGGPAGSGGA